MSRLCGPGISKLGWGFLSLHDLLQERSGKGVKSLAQGDHFLIVYRRFDLSTRNRIASLDMKSGPKV